MWYVKQYLIFIGLLLCSSPLYAQYRVSFVIDSVPAQPVHPQLYLAGNVNNWDPENNAFSFHAVQGKYVLTIPAKKGLLIFKITRGSWPTVECDSAGNDVPNRSVQILSDTLIPLRIGGWKDYFVAKPKPHTMSPNVHIIDTAFRIPQLNRTRRIWIYLPPDYTTSTKKYPVLYMQDGQNLFDAATSAYGEWGIDEILDSLAQKGVPGVIVVGIDNGEDKRLNEYNPYDNPKYGPGEGKAYAAFMVKTLKPFIDTHFRTLSDAANTGVAGSSMGGLISFYAWLEYPGVFGKAGIFSPSFWIAPQIKKDIHLTAAQRNGRIYFIAGNAESQTMDADMENIYQDLLQQGMPQNNLKLVVVPGGKHSESYWHQEFGQVYLWLFFQK